MEYRKLGRSGLEVSVVSFGCWQMAGGFGPSEEKDYEAAVNAAIDAGINLFDTAEVYGKGVSEEILGRILKGRRDKVLIASKPFTGNYSADVVEAKLDKSLARLQTDYVDLYQYHWPKQNFSQADAELAMETMLRLREKGKVRAIGVSNFFADQMQKCLEVSPELHSNQPPYNVLWREIDDEILPFCKNNDIAVLAYSPLAQGLLTGKYTLENRPKGSAREGTVVMREGTYEKALAVVDVMRPIAESHGRTVAQVAINWLIAQSGLTSAICGAKNAKQATDNAAAAGWSLTADEVKAIGDAGRAFWQGIKQYASLWENRPDPVG